MSQRNFIILKLKNNSFLNNFRKKQNLQICLKTNSKQLENLQTNFFNEQIFFIEMIKKKQKVICKSKCSKADWVQRCR